MGKGIACLTQHTDGSLPLVSRKYLMNGSFYAIKELAFIQTLFLYYVCNGQVGAFVSLIVHRAEVNCPQADLRQRKAEGQRAALNGKDGSSVPS